MTTGTIRRAATDGALAWLAYFTVETAFTILIPWLLVPSYQYRELRWGFTVLLFVLYPAFGALSASVITLATRGRLAGVAGQLALVLVFVYDLVFGQDRSPWTFVFGTMAVAIAGLLASSALSEKAARRLGFLTNQWVVALLVAGLPCLARDAIYPSSRLPRMIMLSSYALSVLLFSFLISRATRPGPARRAVITAALAAAVLVISALPKAMPRMEPAGAGKAQAPGDKPNVILVVLDTVRADHLSVYGYARRTTPNLEHFANDAFVYRRALAPADMTLPSHGSLFTGVYASRHGAHMSRQYPHGRPLESPFPTLAEILRGKGYATASIVANAGYLQQGFLIYRGFNYYDDRWPIPFLSDMPQSWLRQVVIRTFRYFVPVGEMGRVYRDARTITAEAVRRLDSMRDEHRPAFLFVNYMDAHFPCSPPAPYDTMFPGKIPSFTSERFVALKVAVAKQQRKITPAERAHLISQYDGGIAYMDSEVARLFAHLKQTGMYDNSFVIVAADHGEAFGDHDRMEHGGISVYQEEVGVPLLIKYPRSERRGSSTEWVSLVDVMPTLLDGLGYAQPGGLDGRSLLAGVPAGRTLITESFLAPEVAKWNERFDRDERAVYDGPMKFITSTRGERELYNLDTDPQESRNLSAAEPATAQVLEAGLHRWLAKVATPGRGTAGQQLRLDTLKSLGYVQ